MERALILIDHGSAAVEANRMLEDMSRDVAALLPGWRVYPAHMEVADPDLKAAMRRAAAEGAQEIVIFPYFLAPGRHGAGDIPRMAREAAKDFPELVWRVEDPFGRDAALARIIAERVLSRADTRGKPDE